MLIGLLGSTSFYPICSKSVRAPCFLFISCTVALCLLSQEMVFGEANVPSPSWEHMDPKSEYAFHVMWFLWCHQNSPACHILSFPWLFSIEVATKWHAHAFLGLGTAVAASSFPLVAHQLQIPSHLLSTGQQHPSVQKSPWWRVLGLRSYTS